MKEELELKFIDKAKVVEHKARHELLHTHLDELVADFITKTDGRPSKSTIMELMSWSHKQTLSPE